MLTSQDGQQSDWLSFCPAFVPKIDVCVFFHHENYGFLVKALCIQPELKKSGLRCWNKIISVYLP